METVPARDAHVGAVETATCVQELLTRWGAGGRQLGRVVVNAARLHAIQEDAVTSERLRWIKSRWPGMSSASCTIISARYGPRAWMPWSSVFSLRLGLLGGHDSDLDDSVNALDLMMSATMWLTRACRAPSGCRRGITCCAFELFRGARAYWDSTELDGLGGRSADPPVRCLRDASALGGSRGGVTPGCGDLGVGQRSGRPLREGRASAEGVRDGDGGAAPAAGGA